MPNFFIPAPHALNCFLLEALQWITFEIPPLRNFDDQNGIDLRESIENNQNIYPNAIYRNEKLFTSEKCENWAIPPSPLLEIFNARPSLFDNFESLAKAIQILEHQNPEDFQGAMTYVEFIKDELNYLFKFEFITKEYLDKKNMWDLKISEAFKYPERNLTKYLNEGKVRAMGRKLGSIKPQSEFHLNDKKVWEELEYYPDFSDICPDFWKDADINWFDSQAKSSVTGEYYIHILVKSEDLLEHFPMMNCKEVKVSYSNDTIMFPEEYTPIKNGRPPLPWEEFFIELGRLKERGELNQKLEALLAYFTGWFYKNFQISVGRSTLIEKIKIYHKK